LVFNRGSSDPIARLRPIPDTDRFELFYWSNVDDRWRTFGNLGRMKLMLDSARDRGCRPRFASSLGKDRNVVDSRGQRAAWRTCGAWSRFRLALQQPVYNNAKPVRIRTIC
jgi:hypothetical protein